MKKENHQYIGKFYEEMKTKVPIKKGCPNQLCFCTGDCQEVVGYRERLPGEVKQMTI